MSNDDDWEEVSPTVDNSSDWEEVTPNITDDSPVGGIVPFTASVPQIGDKLKEFVNPKDPWYKAYQANNLNINVNDPETKQRIEEYKNDSNLSEEFFKAPKKAGLAAIEIVDAAITQPLRGAVAGAAARLDAAQQPGLDMHQRINEFLDPEIIRNARSQYEEMGAFNGLPVMNELNRLRFELAPPIEFWDVMHESDKEMLEGAFKGAFIAEEFDNGPKFLSQLVTSIATDPATYLGMGARSASSTMVEDLKNGAKIRGMSADISIGGLESSVKSGEKSILSLKVPFANAPFYEYNNIKVASAIDDITQQMSSTLGLGLNLRNLSQNSGYVVEGELNLDRSLQAAKDVQQANVYKEQLKMIGAFDEKISRVAGFMSEHGDEHGLLLAKKIGIKVTPDEIAKAQEINYQFDRINRLGNDVYAAAGGADLNKATFTKPSKPVQEQIIKSIKDRTNLDVPRITVTDKDGKIVDLTFSNQYDYGRALKSEEKEARRIDSNIRDFDQATRQAGLGTVSSAKHRNRLSTEAMNAILSREGIQGAYRSDKANLIIDKFLEKAEAARDMKFVNGTAKKYGVAPGMEAQAIYEAGRRVDMARFQNVTPDYDDLLISQLTPADYKRPNTGAFDKIKVDPDMPWVKSLETKVFPKNIALKVDQVLIPAHVGKGKLMGSIEWWQRQWSNNVLTNGVRIGKQAVDNISRLTALNAIPEGVREMAYAMGLAKPDWIDDIAHQLPSISSESAWSMKDFKGPLKVNAKMMLDPETNNAYNSYLATLHGAAKKNPKAFFDIQGIGKAVKSVLEFPNNNKVSKFVRDFGNSADVMTRRAAFRKFMEQGYSTRDSVKMVNQYLMDFDNTTNFTKNLRYVSPFISFHVKNLESIPRLLMAQPVLLKTFKPEDGYLAKAWNDANGWSPSDYKVLQKAFPFFRSSFLGPVLRGQKELINNGKWLPKELQAYFNAGLSEEQKSKTQGMIMSFDVPNFVSAGTDFGDFGSSLTSPISTALQYAAGINPYTGEHHTEDFRDKVRNVEASLNPYQYPKVYNKVILPLINEIQPKAAEALRQGKWSAGLEKVFKLEFGKSIKDRLDIDENSIRELTNAKFLGLARVDIHDTNFYFHQMGLIKSLVHVFKGTDSGTLLQKIKSGDREDILRKIGEAAKMVDDIKLNTKVYQDFKTKFNIMQRQMSPDEQAAMSMEIIHDDEAEDKVPVENDDNEGEEFDFEEVPKASMSPPQDRQPAMGSSSPNSPVFSRLSLMMQRHAWELRNPEVIKEAPQTTIIDGMDGMDGFIERNGGQDFYENLVLPPEIKGYDLEDSRDPAGNVSKDNERVLIDLWMDRVVEIENDLKKKLGREATPIETGHIVDAEWRKFTKKYKQQFIKDLPGTLKQREKLEQDPSSEDFMKTPREQFLKHYENIAKEPRSSDRQPAGQRAFDETSAGGGAGLPSGAGIGALMTGGAAAMMAGGKGGAQNAEAARKQATTPYQQALRNMTIEELQSEDASPDRDEELDFRLATSKRFKDFADNRKADHLLELEYRRTFPLEEIVQTDYEKKLQAERERKRDPEVRDKAIKQSAEYRARPEVAQARREYEKMYMSDTQNLYKIKESRRERGSRPENKSRVSERAKLRRKEDPEYAARILAIKSKSRDKRYREILDKNINYLLFPRAAQVERANRILLEKYTKEEIDLMRKNSKEGKFVMENIKERPAEEKKQDGLGDYDWALDEFIKDGE